MKILILIMSIAVSALAHAQITPNTIEIDSNSGSFYNGRYDNNAHLISTFVEEIYDEAVLTFSNLESGNYMYRLSSLPKDLVELTPYKEFGGCAEPIENTLDKLVRESTKITSRIEVLESNPNFSEIRLTAALPERVLNSRPILTIGCDGPNILQQIRWSTLSSLPSTEWKPLTLNNDKTLVVRIPADLQNANFELFKVD